MRNGKTHIWIWQKREKTKNIGNEKRKQENSPHHVPSSPFQGLLRGSSKPGRRQPKDKMLDIFIFVESIIIVDSFLCGHCFSKGTVRPTLVLSYRSM